MQGYCSQATGGLPKPWPYGGLTVDYAQLRAFICRAGCGEEERRRRGSHGCRCWQVRTQHCWDGGYPVHNLTKPRAPVKPGSAGRPRRRPSATPWQSPLAARQRPALGWWSVWTAHLWPPGSSPPPVHSGTPSAGAVAVPAFPSGGRAPASTPPHTAPPRGRSYLMKWGPSPRGPSSTSRSDRT